MVTSRRPKQSQYRLLGLIGQGQFGRVYCAVHRRTGELVALKDLNRDRFSTHKFLRELRFLLSLEHPNIATCQALEHSATGRQLVLDYCEGGTLRYLIEYAVPLSLTEVLQFIRDILQALDHAHHQGIVHCDIKPENVLLTVTPGGWKARISDFGIARLSRESSDSEMGHTGSPAYMAPERFYNQHPASSDLYAVGIILYELLTGIRPFSGTPAELMGAHLNQWPQMPGSLPAPINEILRKSLQKLLAKRYKTAAEMLEAIELVEKQLTSEMLVLPIRDTGEKPVCAPALPFVTLPHPVDALQIVDLLLKKSAAKRKQSADTETKGGKLLIACQKKQIFFYHWTQQEQSAVGQTQGFELTWPVRELKRTAHGVCLFTDYSIHLFSMQHGLVTIARFDHRVKATLAPDTRWFAACDLESQQTETQLMLRRLLIKPDQPIKNSTLARISVPTKGEKIVALTPLDSRHLLLVLQGANKTTFKFLTRRGTAVGTLHLSTSLRMLEPTSLAYRFLALEEGCPTAVLVIDFKPFRVTRYRLDIQPHWLICTEAGYIAISLDGRLRLISEEGQIVGQVDRLPKPSDVVLSSPTELLWAVSEPTYSRVYTVDLKMLGLDIIF
ncbi:MAG TPA: serine/threonine-protein kinase [Trichocoleus sp.]